MKTTKQGIKIHKSEDFEGMRKAGKIAAQTLDHITPLIHPGMSTEDIDQLCHDFMRSQNAIPATLGYKGYTKSCCTSVNHVICHGIPSPEKILKSGDIVNVDVTAIFEGWHGDTSRMFVVGKPSLKAQKLIDITFESMMRGIGAVRPGNTFGDIGHAIQRFAESKSYSVVKDFVGHGIGKVFHDAPNVFHYGKPGQGPVIEPGMFFTIEPMINIGKPDVKILSDGWTAVTRDRTLSAQFEHTLGVTESGYEIFTVS